MTFITGAAKLIEMPIYQKSNYYILAGTSGTGKSTTLKQLKEANFMCFDEAARSVLEEQLAIQGPALPSNSPLLFVQAMLNQNVKDFKNVAAVRSPVFFDRGMPDLVHYALRFNIDPTEFEKASKEYCYNKKVFMFPPWKDIFINDSVRKMTFEKSVEFHELLTKVYKELNYDLVEVPFGKIEDRVKFILGEIDRLS
ncbi:MAG: AAA family ATPase [Bdellovibrionota bacterium]